MATTTNLGITLPTVGADDDTWGTVNNNAIIAFDALYVAAGSGTSVGLKVGTGKTLNALDGTVVLGDAGLTIKDTSDPTKIAAFQCSGITAGQTRTITFPDASITLVGAASPTFTGTVGCAAITPTGLVDISGASAGQIKFPATQNASTDANTLDDYEEGTFTPGVSFGGGTTGITYSNQGGNYVKVGKAVTYAWGLVLSNKGSSSGAAKVTGFPFSNINTANPQYAVGTAISDLANITLTGRLNICSRNTGSATTLDVYAESNGALTQLSDTAFQNTTSIYGTTNIIATA